MSSVYWETYIPNSSITLTNLVYLCFVLYQVIFDDERTFLLLDIYGFIVTGTNASSNSGEVFSCLLIPTLIWWSSYSLLTWKNKKVENQKLTRQTNYSHLNLCCTDKSPEIIVICNQGSSRDHPFVFIDSGILKKNAQRAAIRNVFLQRQKEKLESTHN